MATTGFRSFDGSEVWSESIESASSVTPMTYVSPNTGKQYILFTMEGPAKAQRDTPPDNEIQEDAIRRLCGRILLPE